MVAEKLDLAQFASNTVSSDLEGLESALIESLSWPDRVVQPFAWIEHIPFAFFLVEALKPKVIVELGVHTGNSFSAFCQGAKKNSLDCVCYGIDTWQGDPHATFYDSSIYDEVSEYFNKNFRNIAELMRCTFDQALEKIKNNSVDILHIDGYHSYEAASHDFYSWLPKMSTAGLVLLHDTAVRRDDFGVWKLFQELSEKYDTFEFFHGNGLGLIWVGAQSAKLWSSTSENSAKFIREFFSNLGKHVSSQAQVRNQLIEFDQINIERANLLNCPDQLFAQFTLGKNGEYIEERTQRTPVRERSLTLRFAVESELTAVGQDLLARLWLVNTSHAAVVHECNARFSNGEVRNLDVLIDSTPLKKGSEFYLEDLTHALFIKLPSKDELSYEQSFTIEVKAQLKTIGCEAQLTVNTAKMLKLQEKFQQIESRNQVLVKENKALTFKLTDGYKKRDESERLQARAISNFSNEISELNLRNSNLTHELNSVFNSKSWKLTAPLRSIVAAIAKTKS